MEEKLANVAKKMMIKWGILNWHTENCSLKTMKSGLVDTPPPC